MLLQYWASKLTIQPYTGFYRILCMKQSLCITIKGTERVFLLWRCLVNYVLQACICDNPSHQGHNKTPKSGAREFVQWLGELSALTED